MDECVHRFSLLLNEDVLSGMSSPTVIASFLLDITNGPMAGEILPEVVGSWDLGLERKPEMQWVPNHINIYFVQNFIGAGHGWFFANTIAMEAQPDMGRLIHEIGHTLGLEHTYSNTNITTVCLCNDTEASENDVQLCQVVQDCLCDTGVDPHSNNLDQDLSADGTKWVDLVTCTQKSEINQYEDGCGSNEWDIPFTNYMSYYLTCRSEFSPCQKSLMHDAIDYFEPQLVLGSCPSDPYFQCADYIIEEDEIWTGEIKMCRGQKIIIRATASLTLNNVTLSIGDPPSHPVGCPQLAPENLWDGIYIEGKSIEQTSNGLIVHGKLNINNSTIEYAKNGINAPNRFGGLYINESLIQKCGKILDVTDIWPFSYPTEISTNYQPDIIDDIDDGIVMCAYPSGNPPPIVRITDSTISCDEIDSEYQRPESQLKVSGSRLDINNSKIINNTNLILTAINQSRGQVAIVNGTEISNFNIGVLKGVDILSACISRGLIISHSIFNESPIINNSSLLLVDRSKISGALRSFGLCHQRIYANNFLNATLLSQMPMESSIYSENYMNNTELEIVMDNFYTDLNCNKWNSSRAVSIYSGTMLDPTVLPEGGWGTPFEASGNKRENDTFSPIMESYFNNYPENMGKFPHYTTTAYLERFEYSLKIVRADALTAKQCLYSLYPLVSPGPDVNYQDIDIDLSTMEEKYDSLQGLIDSLLLQYNLASGQDSIKLFSQISQKQILLRDIVGTTLRYIDHQDSSQISEWADRSNPLLRELSQLTFNWYVTEFDEIVSVLQSKTNNDAETFLETAEWLDNKYSNGVNIFELSSYDLDTLSEFAQQSFGNYTNILRSFLANEYDIYIEWPKTMTERSYIKEDESSDVVFKSKYQVVPNPTNNCFELKDLFNNENDLLVRLYDFNGKLAYEVNYQPGQQICISDLPSGMYFVKILNSLSASLDVLKIIKN